MDKLTLENPVVRGLIFYSAIVILKMFVVTFITVKRRLEKQVYANKEDATTKNAKVIYNDEDVERARRNHLNDLENIPAFIMTAILYTMTGPAPQVALWHFRIFAASRIIHMIVFQLAGPQPIRGSMFMTGVLCTMSMLVQSICAVC